MNNNLQTLGAGIDAADGSGFWRNSGRGGTGRSAATPYILRIFWEALPRPTAKAPKGGERGTRALWPCSCLNLILARIVYWQRGKSPWVLSLSQCDPVANGIDLSLLEHVSPIEWDNVVLYGQYIHRMLVRRCRPPKRAALSVQNYRIAYTLFRRNEAENTTSFWYIQRPEKQSIVWLEACGLCLNPEAPLFSQAFRANLACRLRRHR